MVPFEQSFLECLLNAFDSQGFDTSTVKPFRVALVKPVVYLTTELGGLIVMAETVYACGYVASMKGIKHPSEIYQPNYIYSNIGKFYSGTNVAHEMEVAQDIAGGLKITMPPEEEYFNAKTKGI